MDLVIAEDLHASCDNRYCAAQEEAQTLHEQKLLHISQHATAQQSDVIPSRCSTSVTQSWQPIRSSTWARRPDTAYEQDSLQADDSAAMQDLQWHADSVMSAKFQVAGMQEYDQSLVDMSAMASGAHCLQFDQPSQQSQPSKCQTALCEPVPPNRSKQHTKASPKTRVLASKAWT